jgi:hypothetical protein
VLFSHQEKMGMNQFMRKRHDIKQTFIFQKKWRRTEMIEGSYERSKMNKGTSPRRLASAADAICAANFAGE